MLQGELIGLRARTNDDIEVFEAEMLNDVQMRVRADGRPWRPIAPGSADSPYRTVNERADTVPFSVVELATAELAGEAVMFGIDAHHRNAHLGLGLRPAFRGRHLGTDIVRVLCRYGFGIRGLRRHPLRLHPGRHPARLRLGRGPLRRRRDPRPASHRPAPSLPLTGPSLQSS